MNIIFKEYIIRISMLYNWIIIIASLILGLIDIKDQAIEADVKPYRFIVKLICMVIIIACVAIIETTR